MSRHRAISVLLLLLAGSSFLPGTSSRAFAQQLPPPPGRWATDTAGFLRPEVVAQLDAQLEQYERLTGHQVLLWIGRTTGDDPVEDFTVKTFAAWKVGRKGLDDGLVLFVFSEDRKVRIEVGYGLEDKVTDIRAGRIIQDKILPRLKAGDPNSAITVGVTAILATIEGQEAGAETSDAGSLAPPRAGDLPPAQRPELSLGQKILFSLLAIGFLILLITHPSLAFWLLLQILSGGRGGGGGGG